MNVEIFCVLDSAAERYMDPFCAPTVEFAIRGFRAVCEEDGHQFNKFPEDYTLFHVGSFDPNLAVLTPEKARKVAMASSFVHGLQMELDDQIGEAQA